MNAEQDLEARAELLKALGHPARLLMLNLIRNQPRHVEELAAILSLTPGTVSHHLAKLAAAGVVRAEKDQYYQMYSLAGGALSRPLSDVVFVPQSGVAAQGEEDAYRRKVL